MARTSIWKVISDAGLGSEPQVAGLLRWASDTNRLYIHDGTAYKNVNLTHKGAWSGSIAYKQFDTVTYQGSVWRALRNNIGITPVEGADWTLFVSKGDQGTQGTQGIQGPGGATGSQGANATTTTMLSFVQPASGATVSVTVADTSWMAVGQELYVAGGGYYAVSSITDATHVVLTNRGYTGNAAAGATVASSARVSPAGLQGPATLAIATQAQTDAGTDDTTAVSPLKLYNANLLQVSRTTVSLSAGSTLTSSAFRKLHVLSGASHTTVLPAGATGAVIGFEVSLSATGLYTLDGSGAETLDAALTRVMFAGETAWLRWDGTEWRKMFGKSRAMTAALRSTATQSVPSGAITKLTMDTVDVNVGGMADEPNDQVNIRRASSYTLNGYVQFTNGATANRVSTFIRKNASSLSVATGEIAAPNTAFFPGVPAAARSLALAAGDVIDLAGYHDSAAARNTSAASSEGNQPHFSVREIDPW